MLKAKALFLYPDDFDATTATRRVLKSSSDLFSDLKFLFWARNGVVKITNDDLYLSIKKDVFIRKVRPRSLHVVFVTLLFQFWLLKRIRQYKPEMIVSFYIYTIIPALVYKYVFNRNCKVVYDPRDYFAVCFDIPGVLSGLLKVIDNLFMQLADRVVFPDQQYFNHYGLFKMNADKYFIIPNSMSAEPERIPVLDFRKELGLPEDMMIVPLIGYFSGGRGRDMVFDVIRRKPEGVHFVVAGNIRDPHDEVFFRACSNVTYLDKIPYLKALALMQQSAFIPLLYNPKLLNNRFAIPTKFYDSIMVGTPVVVTHQQADLSEMVVRNELGVSINYDSADEFFSVIMKFKDGVINSDSQMLQSYFLEHYDFKVFKNGLHDFYLGLIEEIHPLPIPALR